MGCAGSTTCSAPGGFPVSSVPAHTGMALALSGPVVPLSLFCLRGKGLKASPSNILSPPASSVSVCSRLFQIPAKPNRGLGSRVQLLNRFLALNAGEKPPDAVPRRRQRRESQRRFLSLPSRPEEPHFIPHPWTVCPTRQGLCSAKNPKKMSLLSSTPIQLFGCTGCQE